MPTRNLIDRLTHRNDRLPPSLPLPSGIQTFAFWRDPHGFLALCHEQLGSQFTVYPLAKLPMVFMSDPSDIGEIVTASADTLHPGAGAAVITPLVGEQSFMLREKAEHSTVRKTIMPAFHRRVVAEHADMVREIAEREIASWPEGEPFSAQSRLRSLTLRVILTTIFGEDDPRLGELHARLLRMLAVTGSLALQEPSLRVLPQWSRSWRSFLAERNLVDQLIYDLIRDYALHRGQEHGVLSLLTGAESEHPEVGAQHIRDNLMSLVVAGHETTASQLAWALQLVAHDYGVQHTLAGQLAAGDSTYLLATIQEVMRHRPVFLFTIPRVVNEQVRIAQTDYRPPAQLVGCIHLMHHDPALYPEPERFLPERFVGTPPEPRAWLPWGGGRKRCPGHNLAMLEMQTVLREALSQRELVATARDIESAKWRSVIVTPGRGCRIVLRKRKGLTISHRREFRTPFFP